jgi:hypothetical protein
MVVKKKAVINTVKRLGKPRRNADQILSREFRSSELLQPRSYSQLRSSEKRTVDNIKDSAFEVGYNKRHIEDLQINGKHVRILRGNDTEIDDRTDYKMSHKVRWVNNERSKDPTWSQLYSFLKRNIIFNMAIFGETTYKPDEFMCADFASALHNNAESNGIRCGDVTAYRFNDRGHALVVFNTTDKGWVFVDPTAGMVFSKRNYFDFGKNYIPDFAMVGEKYITKSQLAQAIEAYFGEPFSGFEIRW